MLLVTSEWPCCRLKGRTRETFVCNSSVPGCETGPGETGVSHPGDVEAACVAWRRGVLAWEVIFPLADANELREGFTVAVDLNIFYLHVQYAVCVYTLKLSLCFNVLAFYS